MTDRIISTRELAQISRVLIAAANEIHSPGNKYHVLNLIDQVLQMPLLGGGAPELPEVSRASHYS